MRFLSLICYIGLIFCQVVDSQNITSNQTGKELDKFLSNYGPLLSNFGLETSIGDVTGDVIINDNDNNNDNDFNPSNNSGIIIYQNININLNINNNQRITNQQFNNNQRITNQFNKLRRSIKKIKKTYPLHNQRFNILQRLVKRPKTRIN